MGALSLKTSEETLRTVMQILTNTFLAKLKKAKAGKELETELHEIIRRLNKLLWDANAGGTPAVYCTIGNNCVGPMTPEECSTKTCTLCSIIHNPHGDHV